MVVDVAKEKKRNLARGSLDILLPFGPLNLEGAESSQFRRSFGIRAKSAEFVPEHCSCQHCSST
jgi:hypothetical protein